MNLRRRQKEESKTQIQKSNGQWIKYNDQKVTAFDVTDFPRECFGNFSDASQFSPKFFENERFRKEKGMVDENNETSDTNQKISDDKMEVLGHLGVFDSQKVKTKEKEIEKKVTTLSNTGKKQSTQNAYMLFYRRKRQDSQISAKPDSGGVIYEDLIEEESEEGDSAPRRQENPAEDSHIELMKTIDRIKESPFAMAVRTDLEKELLAENKFKVLRHSIAQKSFKSMTDDALLGFMKLPIYESQQSLIGAFSLEVKYLLGFLMRFEGKGGVDVTMNLCADSVFKMLSGETLSDHEGRLDEEEKHRQKSTQQISER